MKTKKMLAALLVALSAFGVVADDWGGINRYAGQNRVLMAGPADSERVVLLGNSITDNWPGMRPDFFKENGLVGRGISGQTSYQFLVRFRQDVIDLKPLAVVINVGTNDAAENRYPFSAEQSIANIKSMVELAEANGIKVILTSVLPARQFGWRKQIADAPERIKSLNALIEAYATEKNLPYVDYWTLMADPATGGLREGLSNDEVHPVAEGYAIMERALLPAIKSVRASSL